MESSQISNLAPLTNSDPRHDEGGLGGIYGTRSLRMYCRAAREGWLSAEHWEPVKEEIIRYMRRKQLSPREASVVAKTFAALCEKSLDNG